MGVVDITCDIGGAFEMLTHSTFPEVLPPPCFRRNSTFAEILPAPRSRRCSVPQSLAVDPTSYTLHPTPCILHPTSCWGWWTSRATSAARSKCSPTLPSRRYRGTSLISNNTLLRVRNNTLLSVHEKSRPPMGNPAKGLCLWPYGGPREGGGFL